MEQQLRDTLVPMKALVVDDHLAASTAGGRASRALVEQLRAAGVSVVESTSAEDGQAVVVSDAALDAILLEWDLERDPAADSRAAEDLLATIRSRNREVPVFLLMERRAAPGLPVSVLQRADELAWKLEDTADFIAGRVLAAMRRYRRQLLPPFTAALMQFAQVYEYSWHTPGHTGGTAFLKSPVGRKFYEFFGESLFRSDLSISVEALGSLLDHSGPVGESEKFAARVFGAHRTYHVTNGTSTSNRIIFAASASQGDFVLCDRNCHKSIEHGLTMTGALPLYLLPTRNRYGLIGPIHPQDLQAEAVRASLSASPFAPPGVTPRAVHAVVTNSTYDGLCYRATRVTELLEQSIDRIHFDEAWFAYARFHPIYRERHAMHGDPARHAGPTLFATHSTHKLLAALSQASFIHVRDGRSPIPHPRFNEAFMMHSSTSPQYAILASNEVAAAMMEGAGGLTLTTEAIQEAVAFRQAVGRIGKQVAQQGGWFFRTWNADTVRDPATGSPIPFEEAPEDLLVGDPDCWVLHPGDSWHGFDDLEDGYCMLDPIKVSVLTPGVALDGTLEDHGIPAPLVAAFLEQDGIVVEKTTDFTLLFLFSIGVTQGKWGTLVHALLGFTSHYDANTPLSHVLPTLAGAHGERYAGLGLRDLAEEMFACMRESQKFGCLARTFAQLPQAAVTPAQAYRRLVHGEVESVPLPRLADRIVATGVVPYPPGIPMLMPGESTGPEGGPVLAYLQALQEWDRRFPGFAHDIHGVESLEGTYCVSCLT